MKQHVEALASSHQIELREANRNFLEKTAKMNETNLENAEKLLRLSETFAVLESSRSQLLEELGMFKLRFLEFKSILNGFESDESTSIGNSSLLSEDINSDIASDLLKRLAATLKLLLRSQSESTVKADKMETISLEDHNKNMSTLRSQMEQEYETKLHQLQTQWEKDRQEIVTWNRQMKATIAGILLFGRGVLMAHSTVLSILQ